MSQNLNALVLNADFRPISTYPLSIWSFEDAACAVYRDKVSVVAEHGVELRSQNNIYRPPSVVALRSYVKTPQHVSFTRRNIFLRDDHRCQYCGDVFPERELTFDHVIPRKDGGGTEWGNITTACMPCNSRKGHRRDLSPIKQPHEPDCWRDGAKASLPGG